MFDIVNPSKKKIFLSRKRNAFLVPSKLIERGDESECSREKFFKQKHVYLCSIRERRFIPDDALNSDSDYSDRFKYLIRMGALRRFITSLIDI